MKREIPRQGPTLDMVRQHSFHHWTQWECFISLTSHIPVSRALARLLLPMLPHINMLNSVQLSRVRLFTTPWTAAGQASLSIIKSQSFLKLMSTEVVMPSNHLTLCCPLLLPPSIFPSIRVFQMSQLFASSGQSTGVSASASVLPMNIQD